MNKYLISVKAVNPKADLGSWSSYLEASLPLYGRNIRFPFTVKVANKNEPPYFFGFYNATSLPPVYAKKGDLASILLPLLKDDDTDLKLVK